MPQLICQTTQPSQTFSYQKRAPAITDEMIRDYILIRHIVEEQRASVGKLEAAHTVLDRPGEGTAPVTEKLALK